MRSALQSRLDLVGMQYEPSLEAPAPAPSSEPSADPASSDSFHWTAGTVVLSLFLFVAAGVAEIGGGWLWWQTLRNDKAWWMALLGSGILILYGVIPTFQPVDNFGRVRVR